MSLLTERTHVPLLRKVVKKSKKKGIRKVSTKQSARLREYMKMRAAYLKAHPYCQWTISELKLNELDVIKSNGAIQLNGIWCKVPYATAIHHKRGRVGALLTDTNFFLAVCEPAHTHIHTSTKESYQKEYMLKR